MKDSIIPKDTRYEVPFTQQKSCCVPASISMVMYRLGIPLVSQEELGFRLGLIVAKENKHLFWNAFTGKKPKTGYGTRIGKEGFSVDNAMTILRIPLKMIDHPMSEFETQKDLISFVSKTIKEGRDLLVYVHSGKLNDNDKESGHICVVDRLYPRKNTIRIVDPAPDQPKWREFPIWKLEEAMKAHPEGGGFWEIRKIKQ